MRSPVAAEEELCLCLSRGQYYIIYHIFMILPPISLTRISGSAASLECSSVLFFVVVVHIHNIEHMETEAGPRGPEVSPGSLGEHHV